MKPEQVQDKIRDFVVENFLFGEPGGVGDDQSLLKSGVVDSTGVLELIAFVEDQFNVRFTDSELVAENFDRIDRMAACVAGKLSHRTAPERERQQ